MFILDNVINIQEILIANIMGITILFVTAVANFWRVKEKTKENKYLMIMFFACLANCISDPLCFLFDGKEGLFNRIIVIGFNSILYYGGLVIAYFWILLVKNRMNIKISKIHRFIVDIIFAISSLLIIVNLFVPVYFETSEKNVYKRLDGYYFYIASYVLFVIDGLVLYSVKRKNSGDLKFFPAWAFIIPAAFGIVVQVIHYGLSTATPFVNVSMVCIVLCLQNEFMLRDKLTGLYNRFFLDNIEKRLKSTKKYKYSIIMIDINDFKKINDDYGHNTGDEALKLLSSVLIDTVDKKGEIIRYAGDEFIIVLNSHDDNEIKDIIKAIDLELKERTLNGKTSYELTFAYGYMKLDSKDKSMSEYIDTIDKLMYDNKQEYYKAHERRDRRGNN